MSLPSRLPHPIPYQGSKRALAPLIAPHVPAVIETWFEPFAGSAAMTIWAAHTGAAKRFVIADALEPVGELWRAIINHPSRTADRYHAVWSGQKRDNAGYFNEVRDRYNCRHDPVDLLYLTCRCVKNAVRFNRHGKFTQSVDKRRLGMQPTKMASAIHGVSSLLQDRTEIRIGDWLDTIADAKSGDFLYLDPPYLGTSIGRDKRYAQQMTRERLVEGLRSLTAAGIRFALSYDGMTGGREYGPPLPAQLGLTRLLLHAGISSQATLVGRSEETVESLYLSPGLTRAQAGLIRRPGTEHQLSLTL